MNAPLIFGKTRHDILSRVGVALLQVKNERRLTHLMMAEVMGLKGDDMILSYILGHTEMGVVAFGLAVTAWPELASKLEALS